MKTFPAMKPAAKPHLFSEMGLHHTLTPMLVFWRYQFRELCGSYRMTSGDRIVDLQPWIFCDLEWSKVAKEQRKQKNQNLDKYYDFKILFLRFTTDLFIKIYLFLSFIAFVFTCTIKNAVTRVRIFWIPTFGIIPLAFFPDWLPNFKKNKAFHEIEVLLSCFETEKRL